MRSRIVLKVAGLAAAGLVGALAATATLAQASSPAMKVTAEATATPAQHLLTDDWVFNVGAFILATHVDASLNGSANGGGASQDVNFDSAFGTNADATRVRADILWRFLPRHHARFLFFSNDVSRTRDVQPINWGDYTFSGSVNAKTKFNVYELAYEYAFMREPNYEVVGSFGVHVEDLSLQLSGQATLDGPKCPTYPTPCSQTYTSKNSSLPAPLPVLGVRGGWAVAPNWYLDGQAQFFKFKIDAYDGHWWDLRAGVTYMFNNHFGLGAAWNKFSTNVSVSKANFNGELNLGYSGPLLYLTGSF
jgi:hypothetical protein